MGLKDETVISISKKFVYTYRIGELERLQLAQKWMTIVVRVSDLGLGMLSRKRMNKADPNSANNHHGHRILH